MNKNEFIQLLDQSINAKTIEMLSLKPEDKKYLTYTDAMMISQYIKNIFLQYLGEIPIEIEKACLGSELLLAPSTKKRLEIIKKMVGLGGGITGITAIITGIGIALGWGSGVISSITAFFAGISVLGPAGLIAGGLGVTTIAAYFALKDDNHENTEKYIAAIRNAIKEVVDKVLWDRYKDKLQNIKKDD